MVAKFHKANYRQYGESSYAMSHQLLHANPRQSTGFGRVSTPRRWGVHLGSVLAAGSLFANGKHWPPVWRVTSSRVEGVGVPADQCMCISEMACRVRQQANEEFG